MATNSIWQLFGATLCGNYLRQLIINTFPILSSSFPNPLEPLLKTPNQLTKPTYLTPCYTSLALPNLTYHNYFLTLVKPSPNLPIPNLEQNEYIYWTSSTSKSVFRTKRVNGSTSDILHSEDC